MGLPTFKIQFDILVEFCQECSFSIFVLSLYKILNIINHIMKNCFYLSKLYGKFCLKLKRN